MFKRILVPLDGSPLSEAILRQVAELSRALGAEITLLRVALAHTFPGADPMFLLEEEVRVVQEAEAYLATVAERLAREGMIVRTAVRYGQPAAEIIDHVAFEGADLVVVSTHGRSGLTRLVMGSVAEKVIRHATCPVFVVRPPGVVPRD
ncbi:MAG TPA: universal stress protein [Candidatus Acidoferrum sp.]|nr:universal stress protein [Candidatus Acidoferrum sp.]